MGATAALTAQAATMLAGLSSNRQEANAVRSQGDYTANIAERNAQLADRQSADALARGDQNAARINLGTRQLIGSQRANAAASGVDVGSGSALDAQTDAARFGAMDAVMAKNNARRQAWGFDIEAENQRAAAANAHIATDNTVNALNQKAYTTLLTGSAGMANQWRQNPPHLGHSSTLASPYIPAKGAGYE